jgi:hypothetical protein
VARDRLTEIVIKPVKVYGTFFTVDEWNIPFENIEEYDVWFRELHIGKFWVSNISQSSIHMFVPTDIEVVEYIFTQIKVREFGRKLEKSQNSA